MTDAHSLRILKKFRQYFIEWNLFQTDDDDGRNEQGTVSANLESLRVQRISTRIYVVLLTSRSNRNHFLFLLQ